MSPCISFSYPADSFLSITTVCIVLLLASVPSVGIYLLAAAGPLFITSASKSSATINILKCALFLLYDVCDASSFLPLTWECPAQKHVLFMPQRCPWSISRLLRTYWMSVSNLTVHLQKSWCHLVNIQKTSQTSNCMNLPHKMNDRNLICWRR